MARIGDTTNGRTFVGFADLFSGIGAMRLGFEQACADAGCAAGCVGFSEIDLAAIENYQRRFGKTTALGDIKALAASGPIPECDVILAGFPCPAFSSAGKRLGFADERGRLFFDLARVIGKRRPRAILLENVSGLATRHKGKTLRAVLDTLRSLGYVVRHVILNSRDFGVPQNRPRIYIVGFQSGGEGFHFPDPTDSTKRLIDVLEQGPVPARYHLTERKLESLRRHKARHQAKGNGFGFNTIDPANGVAGTLLSSNWGREKDFVVGGRPADPTAQLGRKPPISRELVRRLTPLECERLQGLPDGFTAGQKDGPRYRQIGNAVTAPVIRAISRNLLAELCRMESNARLAITSPNPDGDASPASMALPLTAVELFAGCGGLSQGLVGAGGIDVKVANEIDPAAAESYRLNHPGAMVVEKDLTTGEAKQGIVDALGGVRCDLLVGGVPCQSYSISGLRKTDDPRGSLFEHFIEMARLLAPRVAVIENVPGILSMRRPDGTPVMGAIAQGLGRLGYAVGYHLVNAADFGDPQSRERVVIFAWRQGVRPRLDRTHDEFGRNNLPRWRTVRDAIGDLEDAPEDPDSWHVFVRSRPDYVERIRRTPIGRSVAIGYGESSYRNPPDLPAITVKANNGGVLVHYAKHRLMTPRELALLQSLPDSYRFHGAKGEVLRQVGNAVPVGLATAIGKAVVGMLRPVPAPREGASRETVPHGR